MDGYELFARRALKHAAAGEPTDCAPALAAACRELRRLAEHGIPSDEQMMQEEYRAIRSLRNVRKLTVSGKTLCVATDPIFMRLRGAPLVVRLGQFEIDINFSHQWPRVYPRSMFLWVAKLPVPAIVGLCHPHIGVSGRFCFGSVAEDIRTALGSRNVLDLVVDLLVFLEKANNPEGDGQPAYWWRPWRPVGWVSRGLYQLYQSGRDSLLRTLEPWNPFEQNRKRRYLRWRRRQCCEHLSREERLVAGEKRVRALYSNLTCFHLSCHSSEILASYLRESGATVGEQCVHVALNGNQQNRVMCKVSGDVLAGNRSVIPAMARENPDLLVALAKLAGAFRFREAAQLAFSFTSHQKE